MAPKRQPPPKVITPPQSESDSGEEESSAEEEEEEEQQAKPPSSAANRKQPISRKTQSSSESGSEGESESETGSESESDGGNAKPIEKGETPLSKKQQKSKPALTSPPPKPSATTAARSGGKRAVSETQNDGVDSRRAAKKKKGDEDEVVEEDEVKAGEDSKKPFQRVWSEDDEVAVLKGMVEFSSKKGADPSADMNAFHEFIKKSLHFDVSKVQLSDKIRRLKKKYENNVGKVKNGGIPTFSKPHEEKAYELSKKVWGGEGVSGKVVVDGLKANGRAKKDKSEAQKTLDASKAEILPPQVNKMVVDQNPEVSLCFSGLTGFQESLGMAGMDERVIKRGLELMEPSKRAELEERWKDVLQNEMELVAKRAEVAMETTRVMWEAYVSSNN